MIVGVRSFAATACVVTTTSTVAPAARPDGSSAGFEGTRVVSSQAARPAGTRVTSSRQADRRPAAVPAAAHRAVQ
ncbi:hypothetical protein [Actinoplanes sp. NPDC051411]|uniref:hypothetical protein n=1 Tax=Actinoplanes sp. NPDC051411 TaxID=3155522 RepID=UPI00344093B0